MIRNYKVEIWLFLFGNTLYGNISFLKVRSWGMLILYFIERKSQLGLFADYYALNSSTLPHHSGHRAPW